MNRSLWTVANQALSTVLAPTTTQSTRRVVAVRATAATAPERSHPACAMAMAPHASAAATPSLRFPHPSSATGLSSPLAGGCGGFRVQFHPTRRGWGMQGRRDGGSHVARVGGFLGGVLGGGGRDDGESTRKKYADTVARINAMEPEVSALSDADLRARTAALQERARAGESLDFLLPVRTQMLRTLASNAFSISVKIDIKLTTLPYLQPAIMCTVF